MPAHISPSAGLPCEQCQYLNEPERVYCHNCGAKLDRSLLPKVDEKKIEAPQQARRRIARMTNPSSGSFGREIKALFKVAFFAALLAVILLILQKPDDAPEPKKDSSGRLVSSDMMEALESPGPRALSFTEDDINQYLKQAVKTQDTMVPGIQVVHAYLHCVPNAIRITTEHSILGYPMYSRIDYRLELKDGKFLATVVGGAFGKLPIDPQLMQYCDYAFGSLWAELQRERKQMDKMQKIVVREGAIDLVTKGSAAAR